mmetsp:Transcript_42887/g.108821  ORF Transcript_42887/g.108821 Transcript_42887/m.108821 type:complete len:280 (-) Transcript_42887:79-918(-)
MHEASANSCSEQPREGMLGELGLRERTSHSHHGETAVLQLLEANHLLALLVLRHERAEAVVPGNLKRVPLEDLLGAAELDDANPEQDLEVHAHGSVEVVVPIDDAVRARLEGVALAGDAHEVRDHEAHIGEHADAAVLELGLAEPRHQLVAVLGEAQGVELVAAPGALGTDQALRELAIAVELDARVLVGDGQIPAHALARSAPANDGRSRSARHGGTAGRGQEGAGRGQRRGCGLRRGAAQSSRSADGWRDEGRGGEERHAAGGGDEARAAHGVLAGC